MKNNKGTLILSGLGLNCEKETEYACLKAGASKVDIVHTTRFLAGEVSLDDYDFLVFIGGFLDGDYLGSARVGVNRFKFAASQEANLRQQIEDFTRAGKLIMGICNGFQLLVKLGLLPYNDEVFKTQSVSLTQNELGRFEDRWVNLKINSQTPSIFTKGIESIYLPIRHGEGKIVVKDEAIGKKLIEENLPAMFYSDTEGNSTDKYPENPNGSWNNIAALSNKDGNIFGLMPHPEAFSHYTNHPHWTRLEFNSEDGDGLKLFKNAYRYLENRF